MGRRARRGTGKGGCRQDKLRLRLLGSNSLAYVSAIATDMLLQSMEEATSNDPRPEAAEPEEEFEDVEVDEQGEREHEETALVQQPARPPGQVTPRTAAGDAARHRDRPQATQVSVWLW